MVRHRVSHLRVVAMPLAGNKVSEANLSDRHGKHAIPNTTPAVPIVPMMFNKCFYTTNLH